jgi:flagellar motor switch protein FliM
MIDDLNTNAGSAGTSNGNSAVISEEEAAALLEREHGAPGAARPLDLAKLRITSGRLPLMETLHQSFSALFAKSLGALLKREPQVSVQRIETRKVADYFASLPLPANLYTCVARPLNGSALFSIDLHLITLMVDCYFGGAGRSVAREPERGLTPSEQRFTQLVLKQLCADLKQAWVPVKALDFEIQKYETNPAFVKIGAPGDNLIVNRFLVELPGGFGNIDLALPEAMLEPLRDAMNGSARPEQNSDVDASKWPAMLAEHLKDAALEVRGVMGETRISLRKLQGLKPGDVIPVEAAPVQAILFVDGVRVYGARFGISRGYNALKLTEAVQAPPRNRPTR